MVVHATTRDPRSIITPDAFAVSEDLLGLPLAPPSRRLWALLIDLAVIGVITLVTKSFALVLGVVAAVFFVRAGFKRTPLRSSAFGRAMRFSVGCLGLVIGLTTAIVWAAVGIGGGGDEGPAETVLAGGDLLEVLRGVGAAEAFRSAPDEESARAAAAQVARRAANLGVPDGEIRELLLELVRDDAPWASEASELIADVASEAAEAEPEVPFAGLDTLDTPAALEAYAALLRAGEQDDTTAPAEQAARRRLVGVLAADTLRSLEERAGDAQALVDQQRRTIARLEEEASGGLFSWLRDIVDELGFGFGWASLYLTVLLSWWKGQTIGKRIMGIRVLRLDGEPITWWTAFERAGGYAAGFATGLLGFAQVYWDANRQAIHDHIVGTVVVIDGAERVGNWEQAL